MDESLAAPKTARFSLTPGAGQAAVILDGQDISSLLSRVSLDVKAGQPVAVFLELVASVPIDTIECEAIVTVTTVIPEDPGAATLRFLSQLDSEELDREVLESFELGGPKTYGAAALEIMKRWAGAE